MMTWNSIHFMGPSSLLMETIMLMHDFVVMALTSFFLVIFFMFVNMIYMKMFNLEFNEDHKLENIWTWVPFLTLVAIAIPSLNALYMLDTCIFCGVAVKVTGHQWYWSYTMENPFCGQVDSYMLSDEATSLRLLETDNSVLIPTSIPVKYTVSSSDVLHSWTIPSLGFKMDAIPGRVNQFCCSSKKSGVYYGQCSEVCGTNHSFMPIVMESYIMEW